jgi:hypothetical protein
MTIIINTMGELKHYQSQFPKNQILAISQVRMSELSPEVVNVPSFGNDSTEQEDLQQWFANAEWKEELLFVEPFPSFTGLKIFGIRKRVFKTLEEFGMPLHIQSISRAITPLAPEGHSYSSDELDWTYVAASGWLSERVAEAFTIGVYRYLQDVFNSSENISLQKLRQELRYASEQVLSGKAFKCLHNMLDAHLKKAELELTLSLMTEFFTQKQINVWKKAFLHEFQLNY